MSKNFVSRAISRLSIGEAGKQKFLRHRWQFGLHFSPVCVKEMIGAIEADDTATLATDQSNIQKEKINNGS